MDEMWSDITLNSSIYETLVQPIHQIDEIASPWIDHPMCKIEVQQEGPSIHISSYFQVGGCVASKVLACLYDEEERKKIDSTLVHFQRIHQIDEKTDVVHHHSQFPMGLMKQRDVVVWRHQLEDDKEAQQYTVVWVSCTHPDRPPHPDIIRVKGDGCYRILQNGDDVDVYSLVHTEPGGAIPMGMVRLGIVPTLLACRRKIEAACQR